VLFDVGSVLLRYKDEWLFRSVARRWGLPIEEATETLRVLRNDLQAGRLDEAALWRRFARAFGIAPPRVPRGLWAESLRRRGRPNGEVVAIARDLRAAGCRVGILSNTDASHVAYFRARGWFSDFRPWLLSHELRAVKPEPLAFRRAARRFGVAPGRILLIDDALANVVAARSLGWDAVRYRNARGLRRELAHRGLLASVGTNSPGRERGSGRHSGTNRS
jgi:HAD superfamily hydrolase (TIGR01509 family)